MQTTESKELTCQFMRGSEERPVSIAYTYGVISPKHSSNESNPLLDPNTAYHGVHACAGIRMIRSSMFLSSRYKFSESMPRIGRPSDFKLKSFFCNHAMTFSHASMDGEKTKL